jgi:hypothetical protein
MNAQDVIDVGTEIERLLAFAAEELTDKLPNKRELALWLTHEIYHQLIEATN